MFGCLKRCRRHGGDAPMEGCQGIYTYINEERQISSKELLLYTSGVRNRMMCSMQTTIETTIRPPVQRAITSKLLWHPLAE